MPVEPGIQDPVLAEAMSEINAVLARHKIAGAICLASSKYAAFRLSFPDWSLVQVTEQGINVSTRGDDRERSEASIHLLFSLRDLVMLQGVHLGQISNAITTALEAEGVRIVCEPFGGPEPKADT